MLFSQASYQGLTSDSSVMLRYLSAPSFWACAEQSLVSISSASYFCSSVSPLALFQYRTLFLILKETNMCTAVWDMCRVLFGSLFLTFLYFCESVSLVWLLSLHTYPSDWLQVYLLFSFHYCVNWWSTNQSLGNLCLRILFTLYLPLQVTNDLKVKQNTCACKGRLCPITTKGPLFH